MPLSAPGGRACLAAACLALVSLSGCASFLSAGTAEIAGIGGAAIAGAITDNPAAATGIGLGVQAVGRAGLQYAQRRVRTAAQDRIAQAAGDLDPGAVAAWNTEHALPLEREERGRVTVSRVISAAGLQCKEIVFSIDAVEEGRPRSEFYVAAVCRDGARWRWASAEPATARWGSLQ